MLVYEARHLKEAGKYWMDGVLALNVETCKQALAVEPALLSDSTVGSTCWHVRSPNTGGL